jgi:hypothetical protein
MIRSGTQPNKHDHRDFSFFKTKNIDKHRLGALVPTLPDNYSTDRGLWMPDQNAGCNLFTPPVPPMPYACTDYSVADILTDEDGHLSNPMEIEAITHANANGGTDQRSAMKAAVKLHPDHPAYFAVVPDIDKGGVTDWFDAVRAALVLGTLEHRAVSVGTPWFPEFMRPIEGIIRASLTWLLGSASWHCWNIKGWKTINNVPYLIGKPWIGKNYGDGGFCYFNRADFNRLMAIKGTGAYVIDKLREGEVPQRIDSTIAQKLVSLFWRILGLS